MSRSRGWTLPRTAAARDPEQRSGARAAEAPGEQAVDGSSQEAGRRRLGGRRTSDGRLGGQRRLLRFFRPRFPRSRCGSADPAAVFDALPVRPSLSTLLAARAAFADVLLDLDMPLPCPWPRTLRAAPGSHPSTSHQHRPPRPPAAAHRPQRSPACCPVAPWEQFCRTRLALSGRAGPRTAYSSRRPMPVAASRAPRIGGVLAARRVSARGQRPAMCRAGAGRARRLRERARPAAGSRP